MKEKAVNDDTSWEKAMVGFVREWEEWNPETGRGISLKKRRGTLPSIVSRRKEVRTRPIGC